MDRIDVEGIRLFGYHGCMDEEEKIGTEYIINVSVWANLHKAADSDRLRDTVDYVHINRIVAEEVKKRSKLIEAVAKRIINRIMQELLLVQRVEVKLSKLFPPINGDVQSVGVTLTDERSSPN